MLRKGGNRSNFLTSFVIFLMEKSLIRKHSPTRPATNTIKIEDFLPLFDDETVLFMHHLFSELSFCIISVTGFPFRFSALLYLLLVLVGFRSVRRSALVTVRSVLSRLSSERANAREQAKGTRVRYGR
jgi:hypothetical protein